MIELTNHAELIAEKDRWPDDSLVGRLAAALESSDAEIVRLNAKITGAIHEALRLMQSPDEVATALAQSERDLVRLRVHEGQANYFLARVVAAANISAIDGADGFIERYDMPVGPIHKAIPFLTEQGIVVTFDGRILNGPDVSEAIVTTEEVTP